MLTIYASYVSLNDDIEVRCYDADTDEQIGGPLIISQDELEAMPAALPAQYCVIKALLTATYRSN